MKNKIEDKLYAMDLEISQIKYGKNIIDKAKLYLPLKEDNITLFKNSIKKAFGILNVL